MYYPSFTEFLKLSSEYNMIPVSSSFLADVETPISVYQKLRAKDTFLLESVEGGNQWGRYSFVGLNPFLQISGRDHIIERRSRDGITESKQGNPLKYLREELKKYRSPHQDHLPRFSGGAVGYLGFDIMRYYESRLQPHPRNDLNMHDLRFLFTDEVIAFDHYRHEIHVIVHVHVENDDDEMKLKVKYDEARSRVETLVEEIQRTSDGRSVDQRRRYPIRSTGEEDVVYEPEVQSNIKKEEFMEMVESAKEYIAAGDVFQVVLSQRFEMENESDPFSIYRVLRSMNPSPYMFYVEFDDEVLVGTSPEMLVRVEQGRVDVRPIAGTRPRGKNQIEDQQLSDELLADEKERAEHYMLVDLGRNDVGRISEYGSVKVDQLMEVEYYSHVMHLVSHVSGRLHREKEPFDALLACFPAGTVSGAPKIRALEIIAELENVARNAYAGALGYFSFNGNMDSCITIRTVICKGSKAYVQAGAGIVADSVPENEYQETVNKAKGMIKAIQKAGRVFDKEEVEKHVSTNVEAGR